ncbi:MAG: Multidrug resistance protein MdtG [Candidatus Woesearchaeota archaeon]|nr:Multidrug resistance protein MdtG [Candidatus Woesearchaeota archaeon]
MKQTTKFYITSFLKNQTYFTPILILFLQASHLNYQQIFWVFTIGSVFSFILEIPTGVFADLYGKRKSIIFSKFGIFLSYVVFGFSTNFLMFVIAQLLFEFGNAFRSGTESAYVYDYVDQKTKLSYTEVKGKQKFWARIGESLATALGGYLAVKLGYNWVFFIAALPAFANFILALMWEHIKEREGKVSLKLSVQHAKKSFCQLCKNIDILKITLNIMIFTAVLAAMNKFIQPYMIDAKIPVEWFGFIYAASLALTAIAVRFSYLIEDKFGKKTTINFLTLTAAIPAAIIGFKFVSIIGVILFFLIVIIENIRSPIANNEFHSLVESEERATVGSVLALAKSLGKIALLPIAGYFADIYSIYIAILFLAVIIVVNGILFRLKTKTQTQETLF